MRLANLTERLAGREVALGNRDGFGDRTVKRYHIGLTMKHSPGGRERRLEAGQMIGAEQGEIGALAHFEIGHPFDNTRMV